MLSDAAMRNKLLPPALKLSGANNWVALRSLTDALHGLVCLAKQAHRPCHFPTG